MEIKERKIVFMGTPEFAAYSLEVILNSGIKVAGVVTTPDKKKGRGLKLSSSEVKKVAIKNGLPILQPANLKDEVFLSQLRNLEADLFVVVAFRMLPKVVWGMPSLGTINLHASLLPQYRGAAPINWAIINGEKETGVTTFFINEEIDTGAILKQQKVNISETDTAGDLHDKLMKVGANVLVETIINIFKGEIKPIPQDQLVSGNEELKKAPKIFRENCKIDWNKPSEEVYNFIRGLSPYPGAWTILELLKNGKSEKIELKILKASKTNKNTKGEVPGTLLFSGGKICVSTNDAYIELTEVKPQSKSSMSAEAFVNGYAQFNPKIVF